MSILRLVSGQLLEAVDEEALAHQDAEQEAQAGAEEADDPALIEEDPEDGPVGGAHRLQPRAVRGRLANMALSSSLQLDGGSM